MDSLFFLFYNWEIDKLFLEVKFIRDVKSRGNL